MRAALAFILFVGLAVAACGSPPDSGESRTDTPANTVAVTPATVPAETPAPTGTGSPSTPATGIIIVDAAIDAVRAGNADALEKLLALQMVPCVKEAEGIGSPPVCVPPETVGTPVQVIEGSDCEGFYLRPDEVRAAVENFVKGTPQYYATFSSESDGTTNYTVVFSDTALMRGRELLMSYEGVTALEFGCARTMQQLTDGLGSPIVAATATPVPSTGIAALDAAVVAARRYDIDTLMQQVRFTKQPCVTGTDRGELDGRPACSGSERTGDLVDGFLVANCEGGFVRDVSDVRHALEQYIVPPLTYYGPYSTPTQWDAGTYSAVFAGAFGSPGGATVLILDDAGLVGVGTGCGSAAADLGAAMKAAPITGVQP